MSDSERKATQGGTQAPVFVLLVLVFLAVLGVIVYQLFGGKLRGIATRVSGRSSGDLSVQEYKMGVARVQAALAGLSNDIAAQKPLEIDQSGARRPLVMAKKPETPTAATPAVTAAVAPLPANAVLKVTGVVWSPCAPLAIVNNRVLGLREEIEGYRVTAIGPNQVTFTDRQGNAEAIPVDKGQLR
jgi:hypothetical protein